VFCVWARQPRVVTLPSVYNSRGAKSMRKTDDPRRDLATLTYVDERRTIAAMFPGCPEKAPDSSVSIKASREGGYHTGAFTVLNEKRIHRLSVVRFPEPAGVCG